MDASKAFVRLNQWILFDKLLNIPDWCLNVVYVFYVTGTLAKYVCIMGKQYFLENVVSNEVKQGGILSPKLFNLYMDDPSVRLSVINVGGIIGGKRINHYCMLMISALLVFHQKDCKICH